MSGAFQECLEELLKEPGKTKPTPQPLNTGEPMPMDMGDLEVLRQKWWDDKQIGEGIVKAGGMGIINLTNIIQKNPNLFETKDECKAWLQNKINTSPPIIVLPEKIKVKRAKNPQTISTIDGPPQFTPRRTTAKCPGCSEEILILGTSKVRNCRNCGADVSTLNGSHQPEPHAPMQDVPPSPPMEAGQ